jgi:lysophospholipase L1-like esterase
MKNDRNQFILLLIFTLSLLGNIYFLYKSINSRFLSHNTSPSKKRYLPSSNRQTIYDLFPISSHDIVFIGTSHTEMLNVCEFFPNLPVKNRGISGDVTDRLSTRIIPIIRAHPNKIFIETGFNDILHSKSPDTTAEKINNIIVAIKRESPNTKVIVNNIFPTVHTKKMEEDIKQLNDLLIPICQKHSVILIDAYSNLSQNGALNKQYDSGDGMHLNGKGYLVWSRLIKPYL